MYPLVLRNFAEQTNTFNYASAMKKTPVDGLVHEKMMELFRLYLIVGGMPEAW